MDRYMYTKSEHIYTLGHIYEWCVHVYTYTKGVYKRWGAGVEYHFQEI